MFLVAAGYYYMNKADPDCGTSFSWVTKAMGPQLGWIAGWVIVVADGIGPPLVIAVFFFLLGVLLMFVQWRKAPAGFLEGEVELPPVPISGGEG
ncbi:MAG: hypothetical protein WD810_10110 [Solirubrobacterales bacterium]